MANYRRKGEPPQGLRMARTWAVAHGSAWVLSTDLMQPPGIFSDYVTLQSCLRAMARVNIKPEKMIYDDRSYLYRLDPGVVVGLLENRPHD
jgi:hypothetical protein